MKDPCENFPQLNLSSAEALRDVLRRDKDTRLEGICIEHVFQNDLFPCDGPTLAISDGWWLLRKPRSIEDYCLFKFSDGPLTIIDLRVIKKLLELKIECYLIRVYIGTTNEFRGIKLDINNIDKPAILQSVDTYVPVSIIFSNIGAVTCSAPAMPNQGVTSARQNQAIELLVEFGQLRFAALQRLFANCFLSSYFQSVWDVDGFIFNGNSLAVLEVKQKYPSASGTFGINVGVSKWMSWFHNRGVEVFHFILTKPIWDFRSPALDMISDPKYKANSLWLGSKINPSMFTGTASTSPTRTSIYTNYRLPYLNVPVTAFHLIKTLGKGISNLSAFLEGRTRPISSITDIPRLR